MKNKWYLKLLSVLLVLATLTAALPMSVFAAEIHDKEVYIKTVKLMQAKTKEEAKDLLEGEGYIFFDRNLNEGTGADGVWLGYTTTTDPAEAIYDMKLMNAKGGYTLTSMEAALESQKSAFAQMAEDLNCLVAEFVEAYQAGSVPAQKAYMALNFFRVVDGETSLAEENGLGYQLVHGKVTIEELTEMILFCDATVFDSIVKILTMGIQLRTENWMEKLSALGPYDSDQVYGENETELKRRAKQTLVVLQLYAQTYNAMAAMGLFAEKDGNDSASGASDTADVTAEQMDIAKVDIARYEIYKTIFDELDKYTYGTGTLKDFFISLDQEKNEKALYPLMSILTDGEFAALSYGCFMEMVAGGDLDVSDFADYDDEFAEVTKDAKSLYIYAGVNPVLLKDDTVVGFTDEASRNMALTGEYQFYEKESWGEDVWETGQYAALGIEFVGLLAMIGAKGTLGIMSITGLLAMATAKGASGILAGFVKVCTFVGGGYFQLAVLAIALTVAIVAYVLYLIDEYQNNHMDWDKYPIPEYMYDIQEIGFNSASNNGEIVSEHMKKTEFMFYEVVRDINDKPVDLNARSSDSAQWIAMYVSYDHPGDNAKPIKADGLMVTTGNGETPEGYTPMSRFGEVRAYNLNQWDDRDDVNGVFMFYQQDKEIIVASDRTYYIQDVILQKGESESHCISLLEAAGYTPLNVNLSPNYVEIGFPKDDDVYTYLGYKLTNNPQDAITDIRMEYGAPQATVQSGGITYAASGSSGGVTLYATKYAGAGTPLLAGGLICVKDREEAPAGYEPVNFLTGGPAQSFNLYTNGIAPWMESYFIYFLPETTFTSGTAYLGGVTYYYCDEFKYAFSMMYDNKRDREAILAYLKKKTGEDYPITTKEECATALKDYAFYTLGYPVSANGSKNHVDGILYHTTYNPYRAIYDIKGTAVENTPNNFVFESQGYYSWVTASWEVVEYPAIQEIDFNLCYGDYKAKDPLKMSANLYMSGNPSKNNVYNAESGMMSGAQPFKMSDIVCLDEDDNAKALSGENSAYHAVTDLYNNSPDPVTVKCEQGKERYNFYITKSTEQKPYISAITAIDTLTLYRGLGGAESGIKRSDITVGMLMAQLAGQGATNFADLTASIYGEAYWTHALVGDDYRKISTIKFGYTRTTEKEKALKDVFIYFNGFSNDEPPREIRRGDVKYTMICQIPYNLTGYDEAPYVGMYLYGTTDDRAGAPLTDIDFTDNPFKEGYVTVRTNDGRSVWAEIVDYMSAQNSNHFMSGAKTLFKKLLDFFRIDESGEDINLNYYNNKQIFYIHIKRKGDDLRAQKPYISELYLRNKEIVTSNGQYYNSTSVRKALLDNLFDQGADGFVDIDLNKGAWATSTQIYLGYSRTADPNEAITNIRVKHNGDPTNVEIIDGVTYNLASKVNLNEVHSNGYDHGDTLYLYYTKTRASDVGSPITDIQYTVDNVPSHHVTETAEVVPVTRLDGEELTDFNANGSGAEIYLSTVRPFDTPKGTYTAPNYGKTGTSTRTNTKGKAEGKYIAALFVMDKNTIRQEKLAQGVPSDQCTCDKITDQEVFDRLKAMGATTIIETPINVTGSEYGKSNPNKVFIGYSRTNTSGSAIKQIFIQTEILSLAEPADYIMVKKVEYNLVAASAKKVTELPRAINLIGTEDGQDLLAPRMYLYTSTEGKTAPICDISIDGNPLKEGWLTVRSENGIDPFADIYEEALHQAQLGNQDDSDSYDHEIVYTDELYKWMQDIADMFNPEDKEASPFFIHCKNYEGDSIENVLPYIGQIFIAEGDSAHEALSKLIAFDPDGFIDCDLNKKAGGKYVYLAYKRTDSKSDAIKELAVFSGKNPADSKRINIGNNTSVRFDIVANVDLNSDAGGAYLYLYATVNSAAGEPIRSLRVNNKTVSKTSDGFIESTVKRANNSGFTREDPDLNDGAGGDYIYLIAKRAVVSSNVGALFSTGSWVAILAFSSVAVALAAFVCIKKRTVKSSDENDAS